MHVSYCCVLLLSISKSIIYYCSFCCFSFWRVARFSRFFAYLRIRRVCIIICIRDMHKKRTFSCILHPYAEKQNYKSFFIIIPAIIWFNACLKSLSRTGGVWGVVGLRFQSLFDEINAGWHVECSSQTNSYKCKCNYKLLRMA